jgi:alpha-glucosidase (family GH31 glycosyl hydrolase)
MLTQTGGRSSKRIEGGMIVAAGLMMMIATGLPAANAGAAPANVVVGQVRVQLLSESLVRIELKGREGFEDRTTFHILDRNWPGTPFTTNATGGEVVIRAARYAVRVPENANSLKGIRVESTDGGELFNCTEALTNSQWLPGPSDKPAVWSFADSPRLVPPPWGLTPAPAGSDRPQTEGWDLDNDAPDVYVFVPGGDYRQLRRDFLKLTGPTEMVPLFALGSFDSRWYDYSEATALQQIADYRAHRIPLDVLVIDTGWRENASTGYRPNAKLFPDMKRLFQEAHDRHVRILFNDHPQPKGANGLDPVEMDYRCAGLSGLLNQGLDFWWYDRNWMVALTPPSPKLKKEVWGMRLYHDITQKARPNSRPLIMANVDGIDNGMRNRPPDVASHRFPIQWTGDIGPGYEFLRRGVENAVYSGVQALFPYMSEDLGGHTSNPTPEQYIRWIEYGALSPIYRPHCTHNLMRMPWMFGADAERIARRLVNLRYRLLPVFYAAAHENYETGEPLLRRLDLDFPEYAEAGRNDEYLVGKSILAAPVLEGSRAVISGGGLSTADEIISNTLIHLRSRKATDDASAVRVVWIPPGTWINAWTGQAVTGPATLTNRIPLDQTPIFVRSGTILPLAPEMEYTGQLPWDPITLDVYPHAGETNAATLYEDDTLTTAYRSGQFRTTTAKVSADGTRHEVRVAIDAAKGAFDGALKRRAWVVRIHPPVDWPKDLVPAGAEADGKKIHAPVRWLARDQSAMPFGDQAGAPDGDVFELKLPAAAVSVEREIQVTFGPPPAH